MYNCESGATDNQDTSETASETPRSVSVRDD